MQAPGPDWLGQPRGLWVLAGTELWDRVSYFGMQALLVLYMVEQLLLPGHVENVSGFSAYRAAVESVTGPLSIQALAAQTFGLYVGLIYFAPVIGGAIGDRLFSRKTWVVTGGLLMAAGHLALAFEATFLIALLLLTVGAGLLRGNIAPQVKALYADGDRREADAFQIYYGAINTGAFLSPIIAGSLAAIYGWHTGFAFAAFGMLAGIVVYLAGARHLASDRARAGKTARAPLTQEEKTRVWGLALACPFLIAFWIAQTQVWNVYNLWARDHVRLTIGSFTMPVPWLQAIDGLAPILLVPLVIAWWRRRARRGLEPDDITRVALGCIFFGAAMAWLAGASALNDAGGRAPLLWAIVFHATSNVGWVYTVPIALAMFASRAPPSIRGTMMGVNYVTTFVGSVLSGRLGGFYERLGPDAFWLMHAAIVAGSGVVLLLVARPIRRRLDAGLKFTGLQAERTSESTVRALQSRES